MVLKCLIKSDGMPSLSGALPEDRLSMALLSSSVVGSASSSSIVGSCSIVSRAAGVMMFCLIGRSSVQPIFPSVGPCL